MNAQQKFLLLSEPIAFDHKHRNTLHANLNQHHQSFKKSIHNFDDYELAISRAAFLRKETLASLDKYLLAFEDKLVRNGGQVIWAENARQAQEEILKIIQERQSNELIKAQSSTCDEIGLKAFLEAKQITVRESSFGATLAAYEGRSSRHLVDPLGHLNPKEILNISTQLFDNQAYSEPDVLIQKARSFMKDQWEGIRIGISGANFLLADIGGIAITENEGNIRWLNKHCSTHIVLVGIEKVISRSQDLDLFWSLLAGSATGQTLTAYNTIFTGPSKEQGEPKELIVILLDNGRSQMLGDADQKTALHCIRCGACQNVCPVFKTLGGESYGSPYTGPIGSVLSPYLDGIKKFGHLSHASTLCGACNTVCPVKIDLTRLLLLQRENWVDKGLSPIKERAFFGLWKRFALRNNRFWTGWSAFFDVLFLGLKNNRKEFLKIPPQSFKKLWNSRKNK